MKMKNNNVNGIVPNALAATGDKSLGSDDKSSNISKSDIFFTKNIRKKIDCLGIILIGKIKK